MFSSHEGDVPVHRFARCREVAGGVIPGAEKNFSAQFPNGIESELVFAVEVGGEDEGSAGGEFFEPFPEDVAPYDGVIVEILVAEENDIERVLLY